MTRLYEINKKAIKTYYLSNKDKVDEYKNEFYRNLYDSDIAFRNKKLQQNRKRYSLEKELKIFRNILYI
jgi:hypothetical protein